MRANLDDPPDEDCAHDELFRTMYDELRRCAHRQLRGMPNETLSTTALVNELYVKLAVGGADNRGRAHFMSLAARAMRQVLVDYARRSGAEKRGGRVLVVTLDAALHDDASASAGAEVLALDQALSHLEQVDARAARVVQLHFFGGLAFGEIATMEGVAARTVLRDWQAARAMLALDMRGEPDDGSRA